MAEKAGYRTEYRTCRGKGRFTTAGEARNAAKLLQKNHPGPRKQVYHCEFCGYYHFGTKRRRKGNLR